jgi:hypothetical protein
MNTFNSILLIVILVLIVSDVYFLRKILKNLDKKKRDLPDERYFELKYNINLLKAVSAILIFLIGFLGFNTYNNISENLNKTFTDKLNTQNKKIDSLINLVSDYEENIESLKIEEGESVKNLGEINQKFRIITDKLKNNQEALKYTTKVYVINNLKFPADKFGAPIQEDDFKIRFEDLKTINGESLPKFKTKPMVMLECRGLLLDIIETTNEYVKIGSGIGSGYGGENPEFYYFDMWIAEPN